MDSGPFMNTPTRRTHSHSRKNSPLYEQSHRAHHGSSSAAKRAMLAEKVRQRRQNNSHMQQKMSNNSVPSGKPTAKSWKPEAKTSASWEAKFRLREAEKQCAALQGQLAERDTRLAAYEHERAQLQAQCGTLREQLRELEEMQLRANEAELEAMRAAKASAEQLSGELQARLQELTEAYDAVSASVERKAGRLADAEQRITELTQLCDASNAELATERTAAELALAGHAELAECCSDMHTEIERLAAACDALESDNALLEQQYAQTRVQNDELRAELQQSEAVSVERQAALEGTQTELIEAQQQLATLQASATDAQQRLQAQVAELGEQCDALSAQCAARGEQVQALGQENAKMRREWAQATDEARALAEQNARLAERADALEQQLREAEQHAAEVEQSRNTIVALQEQLAQRDAQLRDVQERAADAEAELRDAVAQLREKSERLDADLHAQTTTNGDLAAKLARVESECGEALASASERAARIAELERTVASLENELQSAEKLRRALHNSIQELRGNVRVFARVRPPFKGEMALTVARGDKIRMHTTEFGYDRVFEPTCTQEEVFAELSGLVQSALDGYCVCVFAYGQTGAGKTHTMQGSLQEPGVIPRAVERIFDAVHELDAQWSFELTASHIEVYNNDVRDLLAKDSTASLDIKMDKGGLPWLPGAAKFTVRSPADVHQLLELSERKRSTQSTLCNDVSSRSHALFRLWIRGENRQTGEVTQGALNLIDLAGSERVRKSGSLHDEARLKEANFINTSLCALGNVMASLSQGASHVPYRDSKLTRLLQGSLQSGKVLMFVNISPDMDDDSETISSLRFAAKINRIELGTAKRKTKITM